MKTFIRIFALVIGINFFLTGCYTIVWSPSQELPNEENYSDENDFYETEYYGNYGTYYETPWWVGAPVYLISPGSSTESYKTRDGNSSNRSSETTESFRNDGSRGNTDRNDIITNAPVTTTKSSGGSVTKESSSSSSDDNNRSSDNSSSKTTNDSSNNRSSSSSSDTRNNSGSRNSDSGRR